MAAEIKCRVAGRQDKCVEIKVIRGKGDRLFSVVACSR